MQLGRYQVSTLRPPPILGVSFSADAHLFAVATESGYEVWRTCPLGLLRRRSLPGTLARAVPLPNSPLIVVQGGGSNPLFPPNKAVIFHDAKGAPVAELEFGERIRGIAVRNRTIVIVLLRRAFVYEYGQGSSAAPEAKGKAKATTTNGGFWLRKLGEWETAENEGGLTAMSTAPGSTLLALPGRQPGHVQLIHLPPCPAPASCAAPSPSTGTFRSPILLAHTHPLSALACSATGSHLLTASERGTLLRVWDTQRGALETELRRGVDPAEIWGLLFEDAVFADYGALSDPDRRREYQRRKGGRVVGWSDKGTIHVWGAEPGGSSSSKSSNKLPTAKGAAAPSLGKVLTKALSLPNYFSSTASFAQYYLPRKNPHAFASTMGAAMETAGVPSMRLNEETEREPEEREWAERYAVTWVEVEVEDSPEDRDRPLDKDNLKFRPRRPTGGMTMGSREERHSFGSDATSTRTATPGGRVTPTAATVQATMPAHRRRSSSGTTASVPAPTSSTATSATATAARNSPQPRKRRETPGPGTKRKERQLVVVTFAGDWYRLRLPAPRGPDDDPDAPAKTKCELVEYRRLGVGGSGW